MIQLEENIGKYRIKVHGPIQYQDKLAYRCVQKIATDKGGWAELDKQFLKTETEARAWFDAAVKLAESFCQHCGKQHQPLKLDEGSFTRSPVKCAGCERRGSLFCAGDGFWVCGTCLAWIFASMNAAQS